MSIPHKAAMPQPRPNPLPHKQTIAEAAEAAEMAKLDAITDPAKAEAGKKETARTVVLEYPVTFAGLTYSQLTVRRLKAKDFRQLDYIDQGGNAAAIAMAALICGVDEAIIDELDATDYLKVQEVIADFFPTALVAKLQAKASDSSPTSSIPSASA